MSKRIRVDPADLGHLPFGGVLRQLRQARGVTQQAVAEAWGVSQSQVSDIEHGRRPIPHVDRIYAFAQEVRLSKAHTKKLVERWTLETKAQAGFVPTPTSPFVTAEAFLAWEEDGEGTSQRRNELNALMARAGELLAVHGQQVAALQQTHTTLAATYTKLTEFLGSE